jgi:hypothetical protein
MSRLPIGYLTAAGLFFLIAAAVILIAMSWIVIQLRYYRKEGNNDYFEMKISAVWGLIRYTLEMPVLGMKGKSIEIQKKIIGGTPLGNAFESSTEDKIDKDDMLLMLDRFMALLKETREMTGWMRDTLSRVRLSNWQWDTKVGTGDSYWTAMVTGFTWSVQTMLFGVISQLVRLTETPKMTVEPVYNGQTHFATNLSCTGKIRLGQAIAAGMRFLTRMKSIKGGLKIWKSILFKT